MNCRGVKTRINIVEKYIVKPVTRIKMLTGELKRSDAEANLTDEYYIFECILKSDKNIVKTILCGSGAAEHFLSLTGEEMPIQFDPLKAESSTRVSGIGKSGTDKPGEWNEETKQLYNAIHWLIIYWDIVPQGALIEIKRNLEKYYYKRPFIAQIKSVNTIISRDKTGKTLTQMIDKFKGNNELKDFDFSLLKERLKSENIQPYF